MTTPLSNSGPAILEFFRPHAPFHPRVTELFRIFSGLKSHNEVVVTLFPKEGSPLTQTISLPSSENEVQKLIERVGRDGSILCFPVSNA